MGNFNRAVWWGIVMTGFLFSPLFGGLNQWTSRGLLPEASGSLAADVAVSPFEPDLVFATVYDATDYNYNRYRSEDPSGEWEHLGKNSMDWITVSSASPNIVYADGQDGLARSADRGDTWTTINPERSTDLAVSPSDPATMYASLIDSGMARSLDGGHTWSGAMSNMPFGYYASYYGFEAEIAVDPSDASTVYVGQEAGLYKSVDGGAIWTRLTHLFFVGLAVDSHSPATVFGIFNRPQSPNKLGLFISGDGGLTWTDISPVASEITSMVLDPTGSGVLYASSLEEIFRSEDRGKTWSSISNGLTDQIIHGLDIDATGHFLFAATSGGIYEYEVSAVEVSPEPVAPDLPALLDRLIRSGAASRAGFVLPVAGMVQGASGLYKTDVRIANDRNRPQQVLVAWLPRDGKGEISYFRLAVPAHSDLAPQGFGVPNIVRRLGLEGVGSLVAIAVNATGEFDQDGLIGGSSRICSHVRNRNPVCETTSGVRADQFAPHGSASTGGMRRDADFRTNVGIANLDSRSHSYMVIASGERDVRSFEIVVPPFSLVQRAIPSADYGRLTLEVVSDDPWVPWLFYGSATENLTSLSSTRVGNP